MGRSSFAKRDREQTKRAKAEAKRQRRQAGPSGDAADEAVEGMAGTVEVDETPTEELLQMIEDLHQRHAEGRVSDDDFETTKADLLGRLRVD